MNIQLQLQQALNEQISLSESFVRVLLEERALIAKNEVEQLPEITEEKLSLINGLKNVEGIIIALLKAGPADKSPSEKIAILDPNNQFQLTELLDNARELAKQCKRENEINSQIVEASHGQVEQILDALLGREKTSVYSADGKTSKQGRGSLGEA